jgi:hypothetical protein
MARDVIEIEILPDGTIKSTTPDHISPANHNSADRFFKMMAELTGGQVQKTKKGSHVHVHHQEETKA